MLAHFCSSNTCEVEAGGLEVQHHSWLYSARYQPGMKKIPHLKGKKKEKETTVTNINLNEVKLDAD